MPVKTYGMGAIPPPPTPPVAQDSLCHAVMVPSFLAPTFTFAKALGRMTAIVNSVDRSRTSFTGRPPDDLDISAEFTPQESEGNFEPKPPPMYCISTLMLATGIPKPRAKSPPIPETFWVEGQ